MYIIHIVNIWFEKFFTFVLKKLVSNKNLLGWQGIDRGQTKSFVIQFSIFYYIQNNPECLDDMERSSLIPLVALITLTFHIFFSKLLDKQKKNYVFLFNYIHPIYISFCLSKFSTNEAKVLMLFLFKVWILQHKIRFYL